MARNVVTLLVLLLAFCVFVPTVARNLDIPENFYRGFSPARSAKKQGPISCSSAETGHVKGVSVPSILYHETGHEENTLTHETGHIENIFLRSALHPLHFEDILLHESELFLQNDDTISAYLAQNGLPIGLLPSSSVASYSISDDGKFMISLQKACYAKFEYEVFYAQTITGKLSYGTISDLSGIQAKEVFIWVSVTGVRTDSASSGYIYFDAGPISKKLSISQFQTIPVCKVKAIGSSGLA